MAKIFSIIPENLVFVAKKPKKIIGHFGDEKFLEQAYICDKNNAKNIESAKSWAKGRFCDVCNSNWQKPCVCPVEPYDLYEFSNIPIKNIQIFKIDYRDQGGRAYKCIIQDKFLVDLREEVLMDIILKEGIQPNGFINGEYVFAKIGTEMKLILVGSKIYQEMKERTDLANSSPIPVKDLIPGTMYATVLDKSWLYLGKLDKKYLFVEHYETYTGKWDKDYKEYKKEYLSAEQLIKEFNLRSRWDYGIKSLSKCKEFYKISKEPFIPYTQLEVDDIIEAYKKS